MDLATEKYFKISNIKCCTSWSSGWAAPKYATIVYWLFWIAAAKSLQSCPTLCDPIDGSPPGSPVPGILQAKTLGWVAISFSNAWKWKVKVKSLSCVQLSATPWTAAYQAPPPMGFSRQEYWSGVPLPSPYFELNYFKNDYCKRDTLTFLSVSLKAGNGSPIRKVLSQHLVEQGYPYLQREEFRPRRLYKQIKLLL